jgi:pimeloyl-ACP methyl ester carboxylesterase
MEQVFELSEYLVYTKTEGKGHPVLMLHSYWGNHLLFDQLALGLSATMKVIRIDLPGHGYSGAPPADYTFEKFAAILEELLISLNIKGKISIIGHSMGGYAAMAFAAKFPERIESMVLMHSPAKTADAQSIKLRNREGHFLQKGKKDLLLQVTIPSNFAPQNVGSMGTPIALLNQTSNRVALEGALRSIHAINDRRDSMHVLQSAHYPILIIIGKYDKVYSADEQLDEAHQIPNAEVLMLDCSGHLGFIEEEGLVLSRLVEFFHTNAHEKSV